ncbi:MAG: hypothetical protein H7099_13770 [Gemmatimonadaceae bacterium]|nr:hypothetical protein [Gemmatimonadaceae bacterium]
MKYMSRTCQTLIVGSLSLMAVRASAQSTEMASPMTMPQMEKMMSAWPMASKDAVMFMTKKYGAPAAMTSEMAMWGKTGPWKRTVVYGTEYAHEFPAHHTDVMQQWVDYKAPASTYDELAMYDGSVVLERTSGEMSARCDKEGANFLALNLADEIVRGKRSAADARKMYGEQIVALTAMKPAPYTERLMFSPMTNTNDPDQPVGASMGAMRP